MNKVLVLTLILGLNGVLQAELLVYEGFDYTPVDDQVGGALAGKNGGFGFGGAWLDSTSGSNSGEAFVYDSTGNVGYSGGFGAGKPDWDGVVDNLTTTGGYAGLSDWSNESSGQDRLNSHRPLGTDVVTLAGDDGILWASMVVHYANNNFYGHPGLALTDGSNFEERSRYLSDAGWGVGIGNGTQNLWGQDLKATFWANGSEVTKTGVSDISTSLDNIIVIKFEFQSGIPQDTISTWFFTEDQAMTEADFNANAGSVSYSIDETRFNTLAFSMIRKENAIDEIRLGDTFADVVPAPVPEPATMLLLGMGTLVLRLRK